MNKCCEDGKEGRSSMDFCEASTEEAKRTYFRSCKGLEKLVLPLELCKKLDQYGVCQDSVLMWATGNLGTPEVVLRDTTHLPYKIASAPTFEELLVETPWVNVQWDASDKSFLARGRDDELITVLWKTSNACVGIGSYILYLIIKGLKDERARKEAVKEQV